jgi:RNA polymerase sigma factor (sigma-70 family)
MPPLSESELIAQLQSKNEKAFSYLYDAYAPALFGLVKRRVKYIPASEEILQNVFLKIWLHIDLYSPEKSSLYTWMFSIARNETIDYIRSKEAKNKSLTSFVGEIEIKKSFIEHISDRHDLQKSLSMLAHNERVIIELYYMGFTCREIGELRGMPEGSVKTKMRGAYKKLRATLA